MKKLLSGTAVRKVWIVIYSLLIATGVNRLLFRLFMQPKAPVSIIEELDGNPFDSVSSIIAGCVEIAIGVFGVVAVMLKNRLMELAAVGLIALTFIGNNILMVIFEVANRSVAARVIGKMKDGIRKQYGDRSVPANNVFTLDIDRHQKYYACCGWTGKDEENIFLESPWYKIVNSDQSNSSGLVTLPDSCCVTTTEKCQLAPNIKIARQIGAVVTKDCSKGVTERLDKYMQASMSRMAFASIVLLGALIFFVTTYFTERTSPDD